MAPAKEKSFLNRVYAAESPDESRQLYDMWASTYDSEMTAHDFTAPHLVAERVQKYLTSASPAAAEIMDAGCGSGAVGIELRRLGFRTIDGLDISQGMLDVASKHSVYRQLAIADLTQKMDVRDGVYDALACCGTFTHGHLGKEPLVDFLRVIKHEGILVATVLETFWFEGGFAEEIARLEREHAVQTIENGVHAYRKDNGGGRIIVLRKVQSDIH